jgi:hypothetical protein
MVGMSSTPELDLHDEAEAIEVMHDLVVTNPRRAFKL